MLADMSLQDKYTLPSGPVYLSGLQALVRLPLMQRARDRAAGLNTAGFISGYRGSPLGGYDHALWQARAHLERNDVRFQPGLNEDLAATAVWGTQQVGLFPGAKADGVFAIWYGKGPGLDRSVDVLRHANWAGTSANGGVLAICGDDHGAQSTATAYQSEQVFEATLIPVLNPATLQDYLDFGLLGFALSRFSGCWVGFKAVAEAVDSSASVNVDAHLQVRLPEFEKPPGGLNIRWPRGGMDYGLEQERRLLGPRLAAVRAFAGANAIDRIVIDSPRPRLGIAATGKAYLDVRHALAELGIDEKTAAALGLRVYKIGMPWPLESSGATRFVEGLQDVLVVEEKRAFVEPQLVFLLYHLDASKRPSVVGKTDETGAPLLPSTGELSPTIVARAIVARLKKLGVAASFEERLAKLEAFETPVVPATSLRRLPFFCSGCPHNTSTRVPEGSRAIAGIGCHSMALLMPERATGTLTHMGGEGATWIGQAPFTEEKHVFQNLGDGTYAHSGLMAIRAAAAAGVNITYKILYNDAVAMTGGQPVECAFSVAQIAQQVLAEGVRRVVVLSENPAAHRGKLPDGVELRPREDLERVQCALRETAGLTVLIYDQTCAAEKRRRRKRGRSPEPPERVFINEAVCEGCGDCSEQSNCISVQPAETEFGRKRRIDQSSCNKDFSCLNGFCPSFVTVRGAMPRKATAAAADEALFAQLPLPAARAFDGPYSILITGIGGTGVVTLAALLGVAAHLEGKACTVLDITGLSQKNGAVTSHVRFAPWGQDLHAVRIAAGGADLLLACDLVVAASQPALSAMRPGGTRAVVNTHVQPTPAFIHQPDMDLDGAGLLAALRARASEGGLSAVDASGLTAALMGDSILANLFLLGFAFQQGDVPLALQAIERAIELNGVAVEENKRSFAFGRLAAVDRARVEKLAGTTSATQNTSTPRDLNSLIMHRTAALAEYQGEGYAKRYHDTLALVLAAEKARAPGRSGLAEAAARNLYKLMAYKDEYEVARLFVDPKFEVALRRQFDGDISLRYHLAPPLLARRDPATGHLRKRVYGPWMGHVFRLLARLRRLRGTAFDVFGYTAERRLERKLIADYESLLRELAGSLEHDNHELAVVIASLPTQMRGFGHVKLRNIEAAKAREVELLARFRQSAQATSVA
jgi:indolepyruvate ferredoxin oxidoreductase